MSYENHSRDPRRSAHRIIPSFGILPRPRLPDWRVFRGASAATASSNAAILCTAAGISRLSVSSAEQPIQHSDATPAGRLHETDQAGLSVSRWQLWSPILRLALRSREARQRLFGILWRHMPALTLEMWRSVIAAVFLIGVFGSWYVLIVFRFLAP